MSVSKPPKKGKKHNTRGPTGAPRRKRYIESCTIEVPLSLLDTSGIGRRLCFQSNGVPPFIVESLPTPDNIRRWLEETTPATELTALLYDRPPRRPLEKDEDYSFEKGLSDFEMAWACAVERLEKHEHYDQSAPAGSSVFDMADGLEGCADPCCHTAKGIMRTVVEARDWASGSDQNLGTMGIIMLKLGMDWMLLHVLDRHNLDTQRSIASQQGASKGGKQKAENERAKAEFRGEDKSPQKARPGQLKMCDEPGCVAVFMALRSTRRFCDGHKRRHPGYDKRQERLAKPT